MNSNENNKTYEHHIGICLSGGGALGFAHIGVLQALEENGIKPEIISGASMGSLIGAMYAQGYKPSEILEIVKKEKLYRTSRLFSFRETRKGVFGMSHINKTLKKYIPHNSFDSLSIPFSISVTNLSTGGVEYINSGDKLTEFLCASSAIPAIFEAQTINDQIYVDGGTLDNMPIKLIRDKCKYLICADAIHYPNTPRIKGINDVIELSVMLMNENTITTQKELSDAYIHCGNVDSKYRTMDFEKYIEIYKIGYNSANEYIKNNIEIINQFKK